MERDFQRNVSDFAPLVDNWYNIELRILAEYAEMIIDNTVQGSLQSTHDYTDTETLEIGLRVNSWTDAQQSRITEYDWVFLRKLCDPEPTHGETILVSYVIIIDRAQVSADTSYLGNPQTVSFHVTWNNGSNMDEGYLSVNGSSYTINSTGWATITYDASSVGSKTWTITGVEVDNNFIYFQIVSDPSITFFDRIRAEYNIETLVPGSFQVAVTLNSEYNAVPISDAALAINGVLVEDLGNGVYRAEISSWLPFLSITINAEKEYFDTMNAEMTSFSIGNIILEFTVIIVGVVVVSKLNKQRIERKRRSLTLNELEKLVKERGQIKLKEAANKLSLDVAEINTLLQLLMRNERVEGTFTLDGTSFITEDKLIEEVLKGIE